MRLTSWRRGSSISFGIQIWGSDLVLCRIADAVCRDDLDCWAGVRSLREACVHWSNAQRLEKDSLPSGVAGTQVRHEIPSAFVAQSLLSAGPLARLARRHARSSGPARWALKTYF